ncbi:hypothetical protein Aduo_014966 [Ancylostoma duodenale]
MATVRFERCREPKLLKTYSIRSIFVQCMACPIAALVLSFTLGSIFHPEALYSYRWTCGEQRRKKLQLIFLASVTSTIPVIFVFFVLYNVYCIPTTYELFAIFEYATVAGIYGFHVTSFWRMTGYLRVYHSNLKMHSVRV